MKKKNINIILLNLVYIQSFLILIISIYRIVCVSELEFFYSYYIYIIDIFVLDNIFFDMFNFWTSNLNVLRVSIFATVSDDLPWIITIVNNHCFISVYEPILKVLRIKNNSSFITTAISIVNVVPLELRDMLHKQQCFCYEPIRIYPWATLYLPIVLEVVDNVIDIVPNFRSVIIYYTFFRISW